ncbi:MAG: hypothetical protein AB7J28_12300 [Hyphomonadaceae bacterium]
MARLIVPTLLTSALLLSACGQAQAPGETATTTGAEAPGAPAEEAQAPNPAIPELNGQSYDAARTALIDAGWAPAPAASQAEAATGNGPIFLARGYTEVESCSGTGVAACRFVFAAPNGARLIVMTRGEEAEDGAHHASVYSVFLESEAEAAPD